MYCLFYLAKEKKKRILSKGQTKKRLRFPFFNVGNRASQFSKEPLGVSLYRLFNYHMKISVCLRNIRLSGHITLSCEWLGQQTQSNYLTFHRTERRKPATEDNSREATTEDNYRTARRMEQPK